MGDGSRARRRVTVAGIVQGVGFRPFVYALAARQGLAGFVLNDGSGVVVEVEGYVADLDEFCDSLRSQAPPLARLDDIAITALPIRNESTFVIVESKGGAARRTLVSADVATCLDCLHELRQPPDRRFRYPFINCTNCGPRFTIVRDIPYDRARTTMDAFPLCDLCREEYENPIDRRFHAQPNACPRCGPQLRFYAADGTALDVADPLHRAVEGLIAGEILAIKGLGGYHLACDATNSDAVARLRSRKHRDAKPFALMVPDPASAQLLCTVDGAEAELMQSRRRPIVLLNRRPSADVACGVAPGYNTLGLMLPYTPLHHLLFDAYIVHKGRRSPCALVMTSGNFSDEPIAYQDADAQLRLAPIVDGRLGHDRAIHVRCDDSVVRWVGHGPQLLRRSRGYVPEPIRIKEALADHVLACGGHLKNTFCLARDNLAFVSHHIGDLENLQTLTSFREGIDHFKRLFDVNPSVIAYDMHPEYLATKYALALDAPIKIAVQHHHAHIAGVLAEHHFDGPAIGVAADGTGYGTDGSVWGGEVLIADQRDYERIGHLAYMPLPGAEQAIRQPWRMAAVYLAAAFGPDFLELGLAFVDRLDKQIWRTMDTMIERRLNTPLTSSCGRLFDAVAALVGVRDDVNYEGQAAIELETLAPTGRLEPYPFAIVGGPMLQLDMRPAIRAIVDDLLRDTPVEDISGRFHSTVAHLLTEVCRRVRARSGLQTVALSGGVFQNRLLFEHMLELLDADGFAVLTNRQLPPNDGGLSFGQLAVAAARLRAE